MMSVFFVTSPFFSACWNAKQDLVSEQCMICPENLVPLAILLQRFLSHSVSIAAF